MRRSAFASAVVVTALFLVGCSTSPPTAQEKSNLKDDSAVALDRLKQQDAGLADFLNRAYGYAIFPSVGKGGFIAGGAWGRGVAYEQGRMAGYSDLTQATVGAQVGGQSYDELVVFQDQAAMDRFKSGKLSFSANASAVAIKSGAAAAAKYADGVAIFVKPEAGLMAEAAVGGQQFTFLTTDAANHAQTANDRYNDSSSSHMETKTVKSSDGTYHEEKTETHTP